MPCSCTTNHKNLPDVTPKAHFNGFICSPYFFFFSVIQRGKTSAKIA
jgi:hypothetical protein